MTTGPATLLPAVAVAAAVGLVVGYKVGVSRGEDRAREDSAAIAFTATIASLNPETNGGCLTPSSGTRLGPLTTQSGQVCGPLWWASGGPAKVGTSVFVYAIRDRTLDDTDVSGFLISLNP